MLTTKLFDKSNYEEIKKKKVVSEIICPDQIGYVKNRYISENVRLFLDLMFYSKEKNLPGLLFSLILEKSSILSKFNFAPDIQIHQRQA